MKNEDLFYAMSFLDDDLIEEANKADNKAVVTPVKKTSRPKAKVIPLVAPWIAAAAALLVVGGLIIYGSRAGSSGMKSESISQGASVAAEKSDSEAFMEVTIAVDEVEGGGRDSYSTDNGNYAVDNGIEVTTTTLYPVEDEDEIEDDTAGAVQEHTLDIDSAPCMFTYGDDIYLIVDYVPSDSVDAIRGDLIGTVTESDVDGLSDQEIYMYIGEEDKVLVFYAEAGEYYEAVRLGI